MYMMRAVAVCCGFAVCSAFFTRSSDAPQHVHVSPPVLSLRLVTMSGEEKYGTQLEYNDEHDLQQKLRDELKKYRESVNDSKECSTEFALEGKKLDLDAISTAFINSVLDKPCIDIQIVRQACKRLTLLKLVSVDNQPIEEKLLEYENTREFEAGLCDTLTSYKKHMTYLLSTGFIFEGQKFDSFDVHARQFPVALTGAFGSPEIAIQIVEQPTCRLVFKNRERDDVVPFDIMMTKNGSVGREFLKRLEDKLGAESRYKIKVNDKEAAKMGSVSNSIFEQEQTVSTTVIQMYGDTNFYLVKFTDCTQ